MINSPALNFSFASEEASCSSFAKTLKDEKSRQQAVSSRQKVFLTEIIIDKLFLGC
jgi:hypothetical protein